MRALASQLGESRSTLRRLEKLRVTCRVAERLFGKLAALQGLKPELPLLALMGAS